MADSNIDSHAYLFRFMSELNDEEKENLVKQRNSINTENIINHFRISKQRFNKVFLKKSFLFPMFLPFHLKFLFISII